MSRLSLKIAVQSFLLVYLLRSVVLSKSNSGVGSLKTKCIDEERRALLKFKDNLEACFNETSLPSWGYEEEKKDCCSWDGIGCDNITGHVIMLDLSHQCLSTRGKYMGLPLIELRYLNYLDLSGMGLSGNNLSSLIGNNMVSLQYLDLSNTQIGGSIPESFGNNMTALSQLNLYNSGLEGSIPEAFCNTASLQYLDLSHNDLIGPIPKCLGNMTLLEHLDLCYNNLDGSIPECFSNNMIMLTYLALGNNQLEGPIPEAFGNMPKLEHLDIGFNQVSGEIPKSIWNICTLGELFMNSNNLSGQLPELTHSSSSCTNHSLLRLILRDNRITGLFPSLSLFSYLKSLDLSSNQISGTVHPSIGQLSELVYLNISDNHLEGVISEAHFSELSELLYLDLSSNKLIFNVSSAWVPPFILRQIYLSSCKLGPKFPRWLQTQNDYSWLDISNTGISDSIPSWFWVSPTNLIGNVNVSNNQLSGMIIGNYSTSHTIDASAIDLSSNQLEGAVPMFLFQGWTSILNLSRNKFSSINSMCGVRDHAKLKVLDISHNQLSGNLPDCWWPFEDLVVLNLAYNYELSGEIPTSIGSMTHISSLHLTSNKFIGKLPSSLEECKELTVIDAGDNNLSGPIPSWIGERLENLAIINLRSNRFYGNIPSSLCHLSRLQLLDLSMNNISGSIPKCLYKFSEMRSINSTANASTAIEHFYYYTSNIASESDEAVAYADSTQVIWKGVLSEYGNTLGLVKGINLSSNMLYGEIPAEITELVGLIYFNLSRNNLSGQIPRDIGYLKLLDFLDLSNNQFSGQIPPSLGLIDRLGVLDLSNNNLSGNIPKSTQLQSFNADTYMGNIGLCGAPLPNKCPGEEEPISPRSAPTTEEDHKDEFISRGFYVSLGVGYVVGFWGLCGTLIFNKSWRFAYFKFLNDFTDWIYVLVAVRKAKLLRKLQG